MSVARPWTGERVRDRAAAQRLIGRAFPDLAGEPVEPLAEGWDSTVFTVGAEWAFQFPRRAAVIPGLRRVIDVLPRVAPALPLDVSAPELVAFDDHPSDPWPFVGCRFIAGTELAEADLSQGQRVPIAAAVGAFLRALHELDTSEYRDALPVDPNGRGWPAGSLDYTLSVLDSLQSRGVVEVEPSASERINQLLQRAAELPAPSDRPVLVHGDLHMRHVIIGPGGAAAGIIDWIDVCLADPSLDLSIAYSTFAGPARSAFFGAYGVDAPDLERELRARALAIKLSLLLADYAADQGLEPLLSESLAGLARAAL